jgi:3-phytase/alkaline phosphatase D
MVRSRQQRLDVRKVAASVVVASFMCAVPAVAGPVTGTSVRFATFNASLNRNGAGELLADMNAAGIVDTSVAYPNAASIAGLSVQQRRVLQAHYVAETLQRIDADVVLVNEFDYDLNGVATTTSTPSPIGYRSAAHQAFNDAFLSAAHGGGSTGRSATSALDYDHGYTPATNTGLASGFDLDNNGAIGGGNDAFGFGSFGGQFGFTIFSKYEVTNVRTFQNFLWKDMPGNLLTNDPTANDLENFYSPEEVAALRLSSKNHVDVTLNVDGVEVHFLTAHPTPPVFDGAEDRNGKRNFDEIRFWKDYINGAGYIYDDQGGTGGLGSGALFVIAGDYNADLCDGDSFKVACIGRDQPGIGPNAIGQLLLDPLVNTGVTPASAGGTAAATDPSNNGPANASHLQDPMFDTADFNDAAPGNLRVDYVLPSISLDILDSGVFWPERADPNFPLVGTFNNVNLFAGFPTSDHKAVFVDVRIPSHGVPAPAGLSLLLGAAVLAGLGRRRVPAR